MILAKSPNDLSVLYFCVIHALILCLFVCFLQSIDPGQQFTWEHSNLEVNKPKNRYANVIAYDHSRVLLSAIDGASPVGATRGCAMIFL